MYLKTLAYLIYGCHRSVRATKNSHDRYAPKESVSDPPPPPQKKKKRQTFCFKTLM